MTRIVAKEWHLGAVREQVRGGHPNPRVLLVGEDNPQSADPALALFPQPVNVAGWRLMHHILQVDMHAYLSLWRTNLCNPTWDAAKAKDRSFTLWSDETAPWDLVILLGRKVATAYRYPLDFFTTVADWRPGKTYMSIPHPSGTSRVWNDRSAYDHAQLMLKTWAPHVAWGSRVQEIAQAL